MEVQKLHLDPAQKLAIDGGAPVRTAPIPVWPFFNEDTVAAVAEVAYKRDLATVERPDNLLEFMNDQMYWPVYPTYA